MKRRIQHDWRAKLAVATPIMAGAALIALPPSMVQAQDSIGVTLNGAPLSFGGVPPSQVNGRVLVPLRGVFEALGATVDFDANTNTIYALRGPTQISLRLGSTQATVNGQTRVLDVPAQSRLGRTLVPLRFVSEALGAVVNFDPQTRTVAITADGVTGTTPPNTFPNQPPVQPPYTNPVDTPPYTNPASGTFVTGTLLKVDRTFPPTLTLRTTNGLQTFTLADNVQVYRQTSGSVAPNTQPQYAPPVRIGQSGLAAGEDVRLRMDAGNQVTQVVASAQVLPGRIRFAQGNQITLDDARGTTLTIGPNVRFLDAQGRPATVANLQAGQQVALFVAPSTRLIYQVSALQADVNTADPTFANGGGGNFDPTTGNDPSANGQGVIQLVSHDVVRPLRTGGVVNVTVRGVPNARGTFDVSNRAQNIPLTESQDAPGTYTGTYTLRAGDDVLNGRVTATLTTPDGREETQQSTQPITIDTIPPRLIDSTPDEGATVASTQPNIVLTVDDIGGSGVARANATLTNAGQTIRVAPTVGPNGTVTIVPPRPLQGPVTVAANIFDGAGNPARVTLNFNIDAQAGDITSVSTNAVRALNPGEFVSVTMTATPNGRASFDVLTPDGRPIAQGVAMTQVAQGTYRGTYRIGNTAYESLRILGRFSAPTGEASTLEATAPVLLATDGNGGVGGANLTIATPQDNTAVTSPLTIRGRTAPYAIVDVAVRVEGEQTVLGIFRQPYAEELGTQQVRADGNGNWVTQPVDLPQPRRVTNLSYVITATPRDANNQAGTPVSVTVTTR